MAEGLQLPSTGWWSSLLLLQGISDRPFLGLRLENRCLAQCVPSLQASCFLPYPLSAQKGVIREPIPTSLPAQRLAVDTPGGTTAGKEARSSGGIISARAHHAPQRPSGCGAPGMWMKHPPGRCGRVHHLCPCDLGQVMGPSSPRFASVGQS